MTRSDSYRVESFSPGHRPAGRPKGGLTSVVARARIAGFIFVVLGFFALVTGVSLEYAGEDGLTWVVTQATGDVRYRSGGNFPTKWQELRVGDVVGAAAEIRTGRNSRVVLGHRQTTMTATAESHVALPGGSGSNGAYRVLQSLGTLLYNIKERADGMAAFEVETPFLVALVKGTVFTVNASAEEASVELSEGVVRVQPTRGGKGTTLAAGQTARVTRTSGTEVIVSGRSTDRRSDVTPRAPTRLAMANTQRTGAAAGGGNAITGSRKEPGEGRASTGTETLAKKVRVLANRQMAALSEANRGDAGGASAGDSGGDGPRGGGTGGSNANTGNPGGGTGEGGQAAGASPEGGNPGGGGTGGGDGGSVGGGDPGGGHVARSDARDGGRVAGERADGGDPGGDNPGGDGPRGGGTGGSSANTGNPGGGTGKGRASTGTETLAKKVLVLANRQVAALSEANRGDAGGHSGGGASAGGGSVGGGDPGGGHVARSDARDGGRVAGERADGGDRGGDNPGGDGPRGGGTGGSSANTGNPGGGTGEGGQAPGASPEGGNPGGGGAGGGTDVGGSVGGGDPGGGHVARSEWSQDTARGANTGRGTMGRGKAGRGKTATSWATSIWSTAETWVAGIWEGITEGLETWVGAVWLLVMWAVVWVAVSMLRITFTRTKKHPSRSAAAMARGPVRQPA